MIPTLLQHKKVELLSPLHMNDGGRGDSDGLKAESGSSESKFAIEENHGLALQAAMEEDLDKVEKLLKL